MLILKAIIPKNMVLAKYSDSNMSTGLRLFALDLTDQMKTYPPYQPAKTGYRRTGNLGRSWGYNYTSSEAVVDNNLSYAGQVQGYKTDGPKQTSLFSSRGWQSIEDKGIEVWNKHLPDLQQRLTQGV